MRIHLLACLVALCFVVPCRGNALTLSNDGIVIDDGAAGNITLRYPRACNSAKKPVKIADKKIEGQTATLTFEGGGTSVVDVSSGAIVVKNSDIPEGTKLFQAAVTFPVKGIDGLTWSTGDDDQPFPKTRAEKILIAQGAQRNFTVKTGAGGLVSLTVPPHSFQQLQDLRHFNGNPNIQWTVWINHYPEVNSFTIQVGDVAPAKPNGNAKAKGDSKPPSAPKAKPDEMLNTTNTPVQQPKSAEGTAILKWKGGKKAAFYLAFDDACPTHLTTVIPELQKRKMVGTFYVNPGNGQFRDQKKWTEVAQSPYVVLANHTYTHKGAKTLEEFEQEVIKAREGINQRLPHAKPDRLLSYGKPGGVKWGEGVDNASMKPILIKHHLINRLPFYGAAPTMHVKNEAEVVKWVTGVIKKGDIGHLDFHGVGGDWLPCPTELFTAVLDTLEQHRDELWITDHATAAKYREERKTAELKVVSKDQSQIKLALTTQADPTLYDLPLTLTAKISAAWQRVQVTQGETTTTVDAKNGAAMFDALPNGVEIVLTAAQ